MKIPALFYGKPGLVSSRVRKLAKALVEKRDFGSYDPGPFIDTRDVPGLIMVDEESWPSKSEHFYCYMLPAAISEASPQPELRSNMHEWLMSSLDVDWRFMCTLGEVTWLGLDRGGPELARHYVEAAIRHWPAMRAEGAKFGPFMDDRSDILRIWRTLGIALQTLGLTPKERRAIPGLEPQGLLDLVDKKAAKS